MKQCKLCKKIKDDSEFISSDKRFLGKFISRCLECRKKRNKFAKRFYHNWHDERLEKGRTYYHENRERYKFVRRRAALKRKYGITMEEYEKLILSQNNKCAICNKIFIKTSKIGGGKDEPCVDHNHTTGKIRGILCRGCNLGLGVLEDKSFVSKSNQYLKFVK